MPSYHHYLMDELGAEKGTEIYKSIRKQIEDIMKTTFEAVKSTINPFHFPNTFNLLGYDYLVDENFNVFLLEINTNPSINYDPVEVPFKEKLFPRMLEETFQLTLDGYFPPPEGEKVLGCEKVMWRSGKLYYLHIAPEFQSEIDNGKNRFHLIFSC